MLLELELIIEHPKSPTILIYYIIWETTWPNLTFHQPRPIIKGRFWEGPKLRNQLVSHRGNNIRSNDRNSLEDILRKCFSTGVSYMYSSLFEVSQWCNAVDLLGKRRKITLISCFGEISGSRGMERNILDLISKSSYSTSSNPGWVITCRNDIMLIHVLHGQGSIFF